MATRVIVGLRRGDPREAMHLCDRPICVEPSHLRIGTHKDNMNDRDSKRRVAHGNRHAWATHPELAPRGEQHGLSKLTDAQVKDIRRLLATKTRQAKIADIYGVDQSTISNIKRGRNWSHL